MKANAQSHGLGRGRPTPKYLISVVHDAWTDLMDRPHHPGVYIPSFMQPARLHECTNQRIYSYDFQSTQCNAKCTHNASTGLPVRVSLHPTHWAFWSLIVYFCHRTYFFSLLCLIFIERQAFVLPPSVAKRMQSLFMT